MGRASGLIKKIDRMLRVYNMTDRVVSRRVTTAKGGDALTGRGKTITVQNTVLSPQPCVVVANRAYPLVIAGQALSPDAEYLMTVSVTAMSRADVTNPNLTVVFTDDQGREEELYIIGFEPTYVNGTDIAFLCVLSSKKR